MPTDIRPVPPRSLGETARRTATAPDAVSAGNWTGARIRVRGDLRAGRSEAVRRLLMRAIMKDVSRTAAVAAASVWV